MRYIWLVVIFFMFDVSNAASGENLIISKAEKLTVLTGYSRNIKSRDVSSEISGKVLRVNYDVGQKVGEAPFVVIDPVFIDFQIENTKKSLERIEIIIRQARSRVSYLDKESIRIEGLRKDDLATESSKDAVLQELEQAGLEFESTLKEKEILQTTLNELAERRKQYSIFGQKGWIVTDRNVEAGVIIQPAMPLARISDYRSLVVPLSVSGEELNSIKALPSLFKAELENVTVMASINWINPEFDERTRKLQIELIIREYRGAKRGGLKFTLPLRIGTDGLYIPKGAVTDRYGNPTVQLKETGKTVQLLVIGESGENLIVVHDGPLGPGVELTPAKITLKEQVQ